MLLSKLFMLMEILCKTEQDSLSFSVQIILPPTIKPDFSKCTMCFRELFPDMNLGFVKGLTVDSYESFSSWSKVMKCPKPGVLLDCIFLVLNQDRSLLLQAKILQEQVDFHVSFIIMLKSCASVPASYSFQTETIPKCKPCVDFLVCLGFVVVFFCLFCLLNTDCIMLALNGYRHLC